MKNIYVKRTGKNSPIRTVHGRDLIVFKLNNKDNKYYGYNVFDEKILIYGTVHLRCDLDFILRMKDVELSEEQLDIIYNINNNKEIHYDPDSYDIRLLKLLNKIP